MEGQFDIEKVIRKGEIQNELEFERAMIVDRKLKLMVEENPKLKLKWKELGQIIKKYEKENWSNISNISSNQMAESDRAEFISEQERVFMQTRKLLIRTKLKSLNLTQQEFGKILGHQNKSYMSELMNGICPFSLKDLLIISKLLRINLSKLIPNILPYKDRQKIKLTIEKLDNPKVKLESTEFVLV